MVSVNLLHSMLSSRYMPDLILLTPSLVFKLFFSTKCEQREKRGIEEATVQQDGVLPPGRRAAPLLVQVKF